MPNWQLFSKIRYFSKMQQQNHLKIELDHKEIQIINVLRDYVGFFNESQSNSSSPLTLRITGGWVRDKLLGRPSHDIDIGIDHQSGETFVNGLKSWLEDQSNNKEAEQGAHISKIHKIKMNPSKSKHLETCTINLFGLDIDFVNLRSETYSMESRIPIIESGTPSQDAHRRDATLNSLFYNLDSLQVEDLTGKGIEDLNNGILRTPLEPIRTFLDDPLRCLRLIRFASTYEFKIEKDTLNAMGLDEIKDSLNTKISRERIGVELKKILMNGDVPLGFKLLSEVKFGNIWGVGDTPIDDKWKDDKLKFGEYNSIKSMMNIVEYLPNILDQTNNDNTLKFKLNELMNRSNINELERVSFWCSLVLSFWGKEKVKTISKKGKEAYVSFWCVLNGIRMPMKVSELVSLIVKNHEEFIEQLSNDIKSLNEIKRSELAQRYIIPYGTHWELNMAVNYLLEGFKLKGEKIKELDFKYEELISKLKQLKLEECYNEPIKINGKEIITMLERKPGPWLKPINDKLFIWQLDNPRCTKSQMKEYLMSIL